MFWLGKTIKKINGSCIAKHMQNEQYKHASGRKLQCGHARSGNQDSDASNTSLPVKCTSSITFSNLKKKSKKTFKRVCPTSNHFLKSSGQRMHPSSCQKLEKSAFVLSKNSVNKFI